MSAESPQQSLSGWDFWSEGLDRKFFARVYKTSTQVTAVIALIFLGLEQKAVALGLLSGLVIGLFSLWTVEATVRLLFKGGRNAELKLGIGAAVKLPIMLAILVGIAGAGQTGFMNIFAVICGMLLVHGTMLVSTVATAMAHEDRNDERY